MATTTQTTTTMGLHDKKATLNFYKDDDQKSPPEMYYVHRLATAYTRLDPQEVIIRDMRNVPEKLSLDVQGFEFHECPTQLRKDDFLDAETIKSRYYPEVAKFLEEVTGAAKAIIFNHVARTNSWAKVEEHIAHDGTEDASKYPRVDGPFRLVHNDTTYEFGARFCSSVVTQGKAEPQTVSSYDPSKTQVKTTFDEFDPKTILNGVKPSRYAMVNTWRPISPILRDPLCVVDARTIAEEDLVEAPLSAGRDDFATFRVRNSDQQEWYYLHGMMPEEVVSLKVYDSAEDGTARRSPQSSFEDSEFASDEGIPTRESIETRAILVFGEAE